ncbi:MAG: hypothetical protein U0235_02835 [Polyangiaceae bacterium]
MTEYGMHALLPAGGGALRVGALVRQMLDARGACSSRPNAHGFRVNEVAIGTALAAEIARVGAALEAAGYFGPFGVDAFTYRDARGDIALQPRSEINARYSMARRLAFGEAGASSGDRGDLRTRPIVYNPWVMLIAEIFVLLQWKREGRPVAGYELKDTLASLGADPSSSSGSQLPHLPPIVRAIPPIDLGEGALAKRSRPWLDFLARCTSPRRGRKTAPLVPRPPPSSINLSTAPGSPGRPSQPSLSACRGPSSAFARG